jgi:hypothetical protein
MGEYGGGTFYTCMNVEQSHFKKGSGRRGRIMEGMNQTGYNICIYGNVTMKPPVITIRY